MRSSIKRAWLLSAAFTCLCMHCACTAVKPYQKNRLNDAEMVTSSRMAQKFEQNFQLYREAASGANGGKSGGGCGCN